MNRSARLATDAHPGPGTAAPEADRAFLLECRLDQLHSALQAARAEGDQCRTRLAESAAREADHARRAVAVQEDLASARHEVASLHRRLEQSEALRAESEGRLLESGARDEAAELARLRREVQEERQRSAAAERSLTELRARVDELTATRETLLTRIAEWQSLVRQGDPEGADLSEFIASLRGEILDLEHRNALGERREADLRERLDRAGVLAAEAPSPRDAGPDAAPEEVDGTDGLVVALAAAESADSQVELLLQLGRTRDARAFSAIRRWATTTEPRVRAAAFEALGRLLEGEPGRLEPHLRWGLADPDPRVRRRVVLAAAGARGVALRPLLEPLRADPDPQVRRVTHEILRRTSSHPAATDEGGGAARAVAALVASASAESTGEVA